jgi:PiT family inorganic phosphate transporter
LDGVAWAGVAAALGLVLGYTFSTGFNDASAVVATTISSRAVSPRGGVVLAATFGALGVVLGGGAVAATISTLVVLPEGASGLAAVGAALSGAVAWNVVTWRLGMPSSSSHALIGGLLGATLVAQGPSAVDWGGQWLADPAGQPLRGLAAVGLGLVLSPILGFAVALALHRTARLALRNAHISVNRRIKRLQLATSAALAFSNGSNDGQKSVGMIAFVLLAAGLGGPHDLPLWAWGAVVVATAGGTLGGGWPIMKTLGHRIYPVEPLHALDSQFASGAVILGATLVGAPVSSTHVVASSIMGVGAADHYKAVRWAVAKHILQAWVTTIPAAAAMAAGILWCARTLVGI